MKPNAMDAAGHEKPDGAGMVVKTRSPWDWMAAVYASEDISANAKVAAAAMLMMLRDRRPITQAGIAEVSGGMDHDAKAATAELKHDGWIAIERVGRGYVYRLRKPDNPPGFLTWHLLQIGQTAKDRRRRLKRDACPIHGRPMAQVGNEFPDGEGRPIVGCMNRNCGVTAFWIDYGELVLCPPWSHLLGAALTCEAA